MKYSQYDRMKSLMESDWAQSYGYDINEWRDLPFEQKIEEFEELFEIIDASDILLEADPATSIAGAAEASKGIIAGLTSKITELSSLSSIGVPAAIGLVALGILFRKKMIRGIRGRRAVKRLKKKAANFKKAALGGLLRAIKPEVQAKQEIKQSEGVESIKDLSREKREQIAKIEKKISDVFAKYVERVSALKTEEIDRYIDNLKIKDNKKTGLKFIWTTLTSEVKVSLLSELMKAKVIESKSAISNLNSIFEEDIDETTDKGENIISGNLKTDTSSPKLKTNVSDKSRGSYNPLSGGLI